MKAKAAREAAEARRQEQERAEQECAAKVAGKGKLDAWMKTKEKWKLVSLAVFERPEAQVQELPELKRDQIARGLRVLPWRSLGLYS